MLGHGKRGHAVGLMVDDAASIHSSGKVDNGDKLKGQGDHIDIHHCTMRTGSRGFNAWIALDQE